MTRCLLFAPLLCLAGASACVHVEAGTDAEALGYGPGPDAQLAAGYETDPVPRPAPTPWIPPTRERGYVSGDLGQPEPAATEPVPYNDDLLRVCEHLATLDAEPVQPATCHARYRIERVFRPIASWKTLAACIEGAGDPQAVAACERETPRAFEPTTEYPRESAVCMHIFAIAIVEQLGPEPMLESQRLLEFDPLVQECVTSLVTDARVDRKPGEYVEMLECIERARTTGAADACE